MLQALGWSARDAVGFLAGGLATVAILINVLFLQTGVHPAPMFKAAFTPPAKPVVTSAVKPVVAATEIPTATVPRPRPADATPVKAAPPPGPRAAGEIITDIQRELVRRGFYDGAVDGLYGPKTDGAIRDFEQTAGLKPSPEPNEALLATITRSPAKLVKGAGAAAPAARAPVVRNDAALDRPTPSKRVVALQRALADYGYGQIKPTGIVDGETQAAIEKFERERKLPVTGQPSDRVTRELAALTGRPLE
jgi:peptidoglycan hydrolase-like protein with peptidoglycan-binding domain